MTAKSDERTAGTGIVSAVRETVGVRPVVVLLLGVLAGYSIGVLGKDAVAVPVVGSVPGWLLGTVGLLVAGVAYRRTSCCGSCRQKKAGLGSDCGCSDDCGDSCSRDP